MHNFRYVNRKEAQPIKNELYQILYEVQNLVGDSFIFNFTLIGSSSRNMITYDEKSNIGFNFDINIEINDGDENFEPKEIHTIIRNAIDRVASKIPREYGPLKKSTLLLLASFTAAMYRFTDCRQQYIRFNKDNNYYSWEYRGKGFMDLDKKIDWLKKEKVVKKLQDYYIEKKDLNKNPDKHSRSIFAEYKGNVPDERLSQITFLNRKTTSTNCKFQIASIKHQN